LYAPSALLLALGFLTAAFASSPQRAKNPAIPEPSPSRPATVAGQGELVAPSVARPRSEYQFPVGQTYVYSGEWRVFQRRDRQPAHGAGRAGASNCCGGRCRGYCLSAVPRARPAGIFFDPSTFCSHNTSRHIEEGFRRVESNITFDYQRGKAVLDHKNLKKKESKHEERDIPGCVTDMLSSIYYVASLPCCQTRHTASHHDGGPTVNVMCMWRPGNRSKHPQGPSMRFVCSRKLPRPFSGTRGKSGSGTLTMRPRSIQMRARLSWGTLMFSLLRIEKK